MTTASARDTTTDRDAQVEMTVEQYINSLQAFSRLALGSASASLLASASVSASVLQTGSAPSVSSAGEHAADDVAAGDGGDSDENADGD